MILPEGTGNQISIMINPRPYEDVSDVVTLINRYVEEIVDDGKVVITLDLQFECLNTYYIDVTYYRDYIVSVHDAKVEELHKHIIKRLLEDGVAVNRSC